MTTTPLDAERQRLAAGCYDLAHWTVNRFFDRLSGDRLRDECYGVALLAVCRAAAAFDPARGAFSTLAAIYVRSAVRDFLKTYTHRGREPLTNFVGIGGRYFGDVADARSDGTDERESAADAAATVARLLPLLSDRERDIVIRRSRGELLRSIAARHGLTRQRVQQLATGAVAKLAKGVRA